MIEMESVSRWTALDQTTEMWARVRYEECVRAFLYEDGVGCVYPMKTGTKESERELEQRQVSCSRTGIFDDDDDDNDDESRYPRDWSAWSGLADPTGCDNAQLYHFLSVFCAFHLIQESKVVSTRKPSPRLRRLPKVGKV